MSSVAISGRRGTSGGGATTNVGNRVELRVTVEGRPLQADDVTMRSMGALNLSGAK
jgi:hypothetical protein